MSNDPAVQAALLAIRRVLGREGLRPILSAETLSRMTGDLDERLARAAVEAARPIHYAEALSRAADDCITEPGSPQIRQVKTWLQHRASRAAGTEPPR